MGSILPKATFFFKEVYISSAYDVCFLRVQLAPCDSLMEPCVPKISNLCLCLRLFGMQYVHLYTFPAHSHTTPYYTKCCVCPCTVYIGTMAECVKGMGFVHLS